MRLLVLVVVISFAVYIALETVISFVFLFIYGWLFCPLVVSSLFGIVLYGVNLFC